MNTEDKLNNIFNRPTALSQIEVKDKLEIEQKKSLLPKVVEKLKRQTTETNANQLAIEIVADLNIDEILLWLRACSADEFQAYCKLYNLKPVRVGGEK